MAMKMPLSPVLNIFGSVSKAFDVSHSRDEYGRPQAPLQSPDRDLFGVIQPASSKALQWAAATGVLTADGLLTLHTSGPVHCVNLRAGSVTVDATVSLELTGWAPAGANYVRITIGANEPVDEPVTLGVWSHTLLAALPPATPALVEAFNASDLIVGAPVKTTVGHSAVSAGRQTYVRHAGEIWKAWGVGNWTPHTGIARYVLTLYFDENGDIK